MVRGGGIPHRRAGRAPGLARQRGPSPCLFDRAGRSRRSAGHPLPPHLAGVCHEEAPRCRRGEDRRFRSGLSEPRAGPASRAGIHHGRVVPGGRALRDGHGRYGGTDGGGGARRRDHDAHLARADGGPLCGPHAVDGRGGLRPPCRHRPPCDDRRPRPPRRRCREGRHPRRRRRHLVGHLQPHPLREGRAESRPRSPDAPPRIPGGRGGAGPREPARQPRRRALRALCLRRRARQRLCRADRPGRAAPPFCRRDGRESAGSRRALSDRRGFPCSARRNARGERRRPRPRPARHARRPARRTSTSCNGRPSIRARRRYERHAGA